MAFFFFKLHPIYNVASFLFLFRTCPLDYTLLDGRKFTLYLQS